jgi:4-hydroxybenzoate polyprenyltransferase
MDHPVKYVLLILAAAATFWAAISWATGFDSDFKTSAVIAIVCLGGTQYLDYRNSERRTNLWEREL